MTKTPNSAAGSRAAPEAESPKSSLILRSATRYLLPLLLLFSVFLLVRGHDQPGGGFAGGLSAAAAFVLYAIAHGPDTARRSLPQSPGFLIGLGLFAAGGSGVLALVTGRPFLTAQWTAAPLLGQVGTPMLFDAGVYLTVFGVVLLLVFSLMED